MRRERDLLVITNLERADDVAGLHLMDDNGDLPDGNAFLLPADNLPNQIVAEIVGPEGAGELVLGKVVYGYNGSAEMRKDLAAEFEKWAGFSSRNEAYGIMAS